MSTPNYWAVVDSRPGRAPLTEKLPSAVLLVSHVSFLAHPVLCRSQALSTLGHMVAWVMAKYLLAGSDVAVQSW